MWNTFFKMTYKECKRFCESRLRRLLVERPLAEKGILYIVKDVCKTSDERDKSHDL